MFGEKLFSDDSQMVHLDDTKSIGYSLFSLSNLMMLSLFTRILASFVY